VTRNFVDAASRPPGVAGLKPFTLAESLEESYRQYLRTTFYFRDPRLRASFEQALSAGSLRKGPFLEATTMFRRSASAEELLRTLCPPSRALEELLSALPSLRKLYEHQVDAIRRSRDHRNVVIATGTGSGKTEAFLYPVLIDLMEEHLAGLTEPGVRALILYPMNALANDQRERLGKICESLTGEFRFTFGQYTGETPEHAKDRRRNGAAAEQHRLPGELVYREEMRASPPHLLLTNYSMLEYLLLRPHDSPLFDDGNAQFWRYLILDEAHQYRGAKGIEMAMLLRRLKDRLRLGGRHGDFRCVATSASLLHESGDRGPVAKFASDLFDEEFNEEDVIVGSSESLVLSAPNELAPGEYQKLLRKLKEAEAGGDRPLTNAECFAALASDARSGRLIAAITSSPKDATELTRELFPTLAFTEGLAAVETQVELLTSVRNPDTDVPLLSARYHLFLRSLEGAFLVFYPVPHIVLERPGHSPESAAFEVALCRECGQHYFVGKRDSRSHKLIEPVRDPAAIDFGVTYYRPIASSEAEDSDKLSLLCIRCGEITRTALGCGHEGAITVVEEPAPNDTDRSDQIARCGACGYTASGRDPVREVVYGTDGPQSVLATTLVRELPEARRRVLAFADGRQEAAFFAWYLEDSYADILSRNHLLRAVSTGSQSDGVSLGEAAHQFREVQRISGVWPSSMGPGERDHRAWIAVYREFMTDEPRISLEGVGLLRWYLQFLPWFEWSDLTSPLLSSLKPDEKTALVGVLLDMMRIEAAILLSHDPAVPLAWNDLGLRQSQTAVRVGFPRGRRGYSNIKSWDGEEGRRTHYVKRILAKLAPGIRAEDAGSAAQKVLREIWEWLKRSDTKTQRPEDRLILPVQDACRLNSAWWRVARVPDDGMLFRCNVCARLQTVAVRGVCPRYRCEGTLEPIPVVELDSNHYRDLYQQELPARIRVEEHTAQLNHEKARSFQRDFRDGRIQVLSSSTTFELGVDLGDLDVVFLRNVPPEPFNYAQRVGRAGRRAGSPGFALTHCRRSPHDLYHFARPDGMMSGRSGAPVLSLTNVKIVDRHVVALALSELLREPEHVQRFENVDAFCGGLSDPDLVNQFSKFLESQRDRLQRRLQEIVPAQLYEESFSDGSWIDRISGDDSRLKMAEIAVAGDYRAVRLLEDQAARERDYKTAGWAAARAKTIENEEVLSFLSRKAVIPKYGFPVDVVELDTSLASKEAEVELQRDLSIAIAEFAPGAKLIANKTVWQSHGLKRVPEREWQRVKYRACSRHNVFQRWSPGEEEPPFACEDRVPTFEYVIPHFGFSTARDSARPPQGRMPRNFSTRPYFIGFRDQTARVYSLPSETVSVVKITEARPGLMAVLCEGRRSRGFYICAECGAGGDQRRTQHRNCYGRDCNGQLAPVSLGHEFQTDVVEIRFATSASGSADPMSFGYSLAHALVEGAAQSLEVPSQDLNGTVVFAREHRSVPPIVIYDNVPGGAGLVARLESAEVLRSALAAAAARLDGSCGCGEDTSCYGCLRSYRNQFIHPILRRGAVYQYIRSVLQQWDGVA
jgi:hypothetical protein